MTKTETKTCAGCETSFVIDSRDQLFYEKMGVPSPSLCPDCRFRRRAVFRNERTLYRRACDLCKRQVITMYHPRSPYVVYCNDCWNSDRWDPFSYAQAYDPSKPFFEQLAELTRRVPKSATFSSAATGSNVNSEYSNFAGGNKDCYLVFNSGPGNENCAYSRGIIGRDVFDTYFADEVERIYECVNVQKSAGIAWGQNVRECLDSWFLLNCSGCQNCFGCVNLRNKSYYFLNEPLLPEEWRRRVGEIAGSYSRIEELRRQFEKHSLKFPRRENNNLKSVECDGEYLVESKNCRDCFEASFSEDCRYSFSIKFSKDCYDLLGHGRRAELMLEGVGAGIGARVIGSWWVENSHDVAYSFATRSSEYCFGCDGVKNGKYYILNKRYEEGEFAHLRRKIVDELKLAGQYGLFFPPQLALFAYNETVGQDNLPLTKEEALARGFRWEKDLPSTRGQETLQSDDIPDHIKDVPDSILNEVLACISCKRNYKLIQAELDMYRTAVIPIPRRCFNCRHADRMGRRGSFRFHNGTCARCQKSIKTNYEPNRPEIVYCEACYNNEIA